MISSYLRRISKGSMLTGSVAHRTLFVCRVDAEGKRREDSVSYHKMVREWSSEELAEYRAKAAAQLTGVNPGIIRVHEAAFDECLLDQPVWEESKGDPYEAIHHSTSCLSDEEAEELAARVSAGIRNGLSAVIFSFERIKR